MKMDSESLRLPWEVDLDVQLSDTDDGSKFEAWEITAQAGAYTIAYAISPEDAEAITRAVNNHEKLLDVLRELVAGLDAIGEDTAREVWFDAYTTAVNARKILEELG